MKVYPKRRGQGWIKAEEKIREHLKNGHGTFEEMLKGANNYRKYIAESGEYARMAQTFFGPNQWWTEFMDDEEIENELTLDDEAERYDLTRAENESDESLRNRVGTAQTKAQYGIS